MTTTGTFACPSCAAPLTPQGDAPEIKCPYCGSVVVVPEELRPNHPHTPQVFGATFTSDHPQVIIGQSNPQMNEEVAELLKEIPQMVAPMMQMRQMQMGGLQQPYVMPRQARRRGCGCSGCFTILIFLIIFGAVGLGVLASVSPNTVASLISQIPALADLKIGGPNILAFTVSSTSTGSGALVTVIWATDGDSVRLEQVNAKGSQPMLNLPASGSRIISVSTSGTMTFKLTAIKNGQNTSQTQSITVKTNSR